MKQINWLSLFMVLTLTLTGCGSSSPAQQPQVTMMFPSQTQTRTVTSTPTRTVTPPILTSTATQPLLATLEPLYVTETLQPLLTDPMGCAVPCFWGIIPGATHMDEVRSFIMRLGFIPFEGYDVETGKYFYTIEYLSGSHTHPSSVTFKTTGDTVENIQLDPIIIIPKQGEPREWIAYSPETLIKKYGDPSRVDFGIGRGPNYVIRMSIYFEKYHLFVIYTGRNMTLDRPRSPQLCPLTAPFNFVRLWLGSTQSDAPSFEAVSLEKATSLTIDRFTQLMLGDPQKACFTLNGDAFQ